MVRWLFSSDDYWLKLTDGKWLESPDTHNGEAYIDSVDYQDITTEQKSAILILLEKYTYKRTLGTLFSDGSISELGDKTLYIYVYDDVSLVGSIFVSSSGRIAVNEKNYHMENAEQFIEQIIEIMGQAD